MSVVPKEIETGEAGIKNPLADETPKPLSKREVKKGTLRDGVDTQTSQKKSFAKERSSFRRKKPGKKSKVKTRYGKKPTSEEGDSNLNILNAKKLEGTASKKETEPWNAVLSKKSRKEQRENEPKGCPKDGRKADSNVCNDPAQHVPGKMATQDNRQGLKPTAKTPSREEFVLFVLPQGVDEDASASFAETLKLVASRINLLTPKYRSEEIGQSQEVKSLS